MNENTKTLIAEGRSAAAQGDWAGAWSLWNTAVRQSEDPVSTRGALALILVEFDEPEGAKTQIEKIRESAPAIAASYAAQIGLEIWKHSRKPEAAAAMMELSIAIAEDTGDIPHLAQVSGNLGKVYAAAKNPERALYHFDRASRYYRQLGDAEWESMMRSSAGLALQDLHRLKEAEAQLRAALEIAGQSGPFPAQAMAAFNLGGFYGLLGRFESSREIHLQILRNALKEGHADYIRQAVRNLAADLKHLQLSGEAEAQLLVDQAVAAYQQKQRDYAVFLLREATLLVDPEKAPVAQADIWHALAQVEYAFNKIRESIAHLEKAVELARAANNDERLATYLSDLSGKLLQEGKLKEAVMAGDEAIAAANNSTAYGPLAAALGNRGIIAQYRDDLAMARKLFLRQWDITQKQALPQYACNAANALGTVYQRMGILGEAEKWLTTAVETSDDFRWPGGLTALINLGHIQWRRSDKQAAVASYRKAREKAIERDNIDVHFDAVLNLGILYTEADQVSEAREALAKARELNDYLNDPRKHAQLDMHQAFLFRKTGQRAEAFDKFHSAYRDFVRLNWRNATKCAVEAAAILLEDGNNDEALRLLLPAMQHFEKKLRQLSDLEAWSLHREEERYAQVMTELTRRAYGPQTALLIAESSRGRAFRLALRRRVAGHRTGAFTGQQALRDTTLEVLTSGATKGLDKERLFFFLQSLSGGKDPGEPELTEEAILSLAGELDTTFVLYAKGYPDQLYAWVADAREISFHPLDLRLVGGFEGLRKEVTKLQKALGIPERGFLKQPAGAATPTESLSKLYKLLIAPLAGRLPKREGARLGFVPWGPLFQIPFCALPDERGRYLVDRYATFVTPSMYAFFLKISGRGAGALVVGDPVPDPDSPFGDLPPLPYAREEAEAVAAVYRTEALTGQAALRARAVELLPQVSVAHFAAHGIFNEKNPLFSAVALSRNEEQGGFLFADDLKTMNLNTRLVVLSTCSSSLGAVTGDGVLGLCREFLTAGAASVVASLWAVADRSSAFHMIRFHEFLKEQAVIEALRSAQLATKKQYKEIAHWAPYVLWGRPG